LLLLYVSVLCRLIAAMHFLGSTIVYTVFCVFSCCYSLLSFCLSLLLFVSIYSVSSLCVHSWRWTGVVPYALVFLICICACCCLECYTMPIILGLLPSGCWSISLSTCPCPSACRFGGALSAACFYRPPCLCCAVPCVSSPFNTACG
jgi:hypothetical protein